MAASKTDRRPERSRKALLGAFIELVLERGYEQTSVADVVERANVGRSTLYAHFGGLEGMLRASLTHPSTLLAMLVDQTVETSNLVTLLEHFRGQRRRNPVFFMPPIRGLWVRRLAEMIEPRLVALVEAETRTPALPLPLVAAQVAEAQLALVYTWLTQRAATPAETIARALAALTHSIVDGLCPKIG